MDTPSKLEEAILFAVRAHMGQQHATTGLPYVLHCLRVMNRVRKAGGNEEAMIVAVLHDVLEDTETTIETIDALFGHRVAGAVGDLTHAPFVNYTAYISMISNSKYREVTVMVKLADLADNLALGKEHPLPAARQKKLTDRYLAAQKVLNSIPEVGGTSCE